MNTATAEGQPVLTLKDLPPTGEPTMTQPRIYYGESDQGNFVVANANGELDYEGSTENLPYSGQGGIPIENMFRRALFAWNFRDINLLLSGPDHRLEPADDLPQHRAARGEGRAVPVVRLAIRTSRSSTDARCGSSTRTRPRTNTPTRRR